MNGRISRRDVLGALGAGLIIPGIASRASPPPPLFKLRTITAGISLNSVTDFEAIEAAFEFLTKLEMHT